MTTRRNNMFYYRGACSAYSTILQIMKETKSDEERIDMLERLHKFWLNGAKSYSYKYALWLIRLLNRVLWIGGNHG